MSFEAESNSELTVIVPAYQLHFRCKTKYTNKIFCPTPGPAYLAVLLVLVIFFPLGPTNFKKSVIHVSLTFAVVSVFSLRAASRRISPSIEVFFPAILFPTKIDQYFSRTSCTFFGIVFILFPYLIVCALARFSDLKRETSHYSI
jgi:hypothetical protein